MLSNNASKAKEISQDTVQHQNNVDIQSVFELRWQVKLTQSDLHTSVTLENSSTLVEVLGSSLKD